MTSEKNQTQAKETNVNTDKKNNQKDIGKALFIGMLAGCFFMLAAKMVNIALNS